MLKQSHGQPASAIRRACPCPHSGRLNHIVPGRAISWATASIIPAPSAICGLPINTLRNTLQE